MSAEADAERVKAEDEALRQRFLRESQFTRIAQKLSATSEIVRLQEEANNYMKRVGHKLTDLAFSSPKAH